jgi:hypothetical protein
MSEPTNIHDKWLTNDQAYAVLRTPDRYSVYIWHPFFAKILRRYDKQAPPQACYNTLVFERFLRKNISRPKQIEQYTLQHLSIHSLNKRAIVTVITK